LFPGALAKLELSLRLSSDVLRHQVIKTKKRSPEQIEKDKKMSEELFGLRRSDKDGDVKPTTEAAKPAEAPAKAEEAKEEEVKPTAKKKTDLKDLDKKLDDILDAGDLI